MRIGSRGSERKHPADMAFWTLVYLFKTGGWEIPNWVFPIDPSPYLPGLTLVQKIKNGYR